MFGDDQVFLFLHVKFLTYKAVIAKQQKNLRMCLSLKGLFHLNSSENLHLYR